MNVGAMAAGEGTICPDGVLHRPINPLRLDNIPAEIILEICDYLSDLSDPDDGPCSLKALRLVSRHFSSLPLSHLFSTIFLYLHTDRRSALSKIANTPHLAKHVTAIELSNADMAKSYWGGLTEWRCEAEPEIRAFAEWPEPPRQLRQDVGSTMATTFNALRTSPSENDAYARYEAWQHGERALQELLRDGKAPPLDLNQFPRLRSVTTSDARLQYNVDFTDSSDSSKYTFSRRQLEMGLPGSDGLDNSHLCLFILATDQANFALSKLQIGHFSELLSKGSECPAIVRNLRHLVIGPPSSGKPLSTGGWEELGLASWVTTLHNLETFEVIRTQRCIDDVDLFAMLQTVRWPKLRRVRLVEVRTTAANLRHFLLEMYRHKVLPFEVLSIVSPVIVPADWTQLKAELQMLDPKPRVLELSESFKPSFGKRRRGKKRRLWWERYAQTPLKDWPGSSLW